MPRTEAGKRLLAILGGADDPEYKSPTTNMIDAIEAEAREQEYERLSHVAWSQPVIDAEKMAQAEFYRYRRMVSEMRDAERARIRDAVWAIEAEPSVPAAQRRGAALAIAAVLAIIDGEDAE